MSRYIDADALAEKFHKMGLGENSLIERLFADGVYAIIDTFPTADVEPVRHGHWEQYAYEAWNCSVCNGIFMPIEGTPKENDIDYCPFCGAKMDGKENE